jgi:aspartyl aminopeptidase
MHDLKEFLRTSYTAYHAVDNVKAALLENGFLQLLETDDWTLCEGGKYFVVRNGGSIIAFTIGSLDRFTYKIAAAHTDSPALKLKEHPEKKSGAYLTLNVETYGVGIWYSFLDRPLKIAGRVVKREGAQLCAHTVESDFLVSIPSLAVHQNRTVNDNFAIQKQVDLLPLYSLSNENIGVVEKIAGNGVVSYDLYAVNADMPYSFGANNEFLASPRIDNLTSAYATLQGLLSHSDSDGVCVAAIFDNEEIGSGTSHGADGDFLENTLKRIAYAFHFDDGEYYKALADSFLLSIDNAHATHPNHPEKSDPTNEVKLGGGVVIKTHAGKAYLTDALSSAQSRNRGHRESQPAAAGFSAGLDDLRGRVSLAHPLEYIVAARFQSHVDHAEPLLSEQLQVLLGFQKQADRRGIAGHPAAFGKIRPDISENPAQIIGPADQGISVRQKDAVHVTVLPPAFSKILQNISQLSYDKMLLLVH